MRRGKVLSTEKVRRKRWSFGVRWSLGSDQFGGLWAQTDLGGLWAQTDLVVFGVQTDLEFSPLRPSACSSAMRSCLAFDSVWSSSLGQFAPDKLGTLSGRERARIGTELGAGGRGIVLLIQQKILNRSDPKALDPKALDPKALDPKALLSQGPALLWPTPLSSTWENHPPGQYPLGRDIHGFLPRYPSFVNLVAVTFSLALSPFHSPCQFGGCHLSPFPDLFPPRS